MTKPELRWQKATQWDCNSLLALENDSHDIHNANNDDDNKDDIEDDNCSLSLVLKDDFETVTSRNMSMLQQTCCT